MCLEKKSSFFLFLLSFLILGIYVFECFPDASIWEFIDSCILSFFIYFYSGGSLEIQSLWQG